MHTFQNVYNHDDDALFRTVSEWCEDDDDGSRISKSDEGPNRI